MLESGKETNGASQKDENRKKQRWLFIPLLLVFVSISSFLAGTRVGNSTDQRMGEMLDTIILSPEKKQADESRIDFSGQMLYTDGTPCSNQRIELHSDPIQTVTDSEGYFYFQDVEIGEHRLSVMDENNNPISEMSVHIKRDKSIKAGTVGSEEDACLLSVSDKVMQIHVKIRVDSEQGLSVEPEVYTRDEQGICMDSEGRKVSPALLEKPEAEPPSSGENLISPENEIPITQPADTQNAETQGAQKVSDPPSSDAQPGIQAPPEESLQVPESSIAAESTTGAVNGGSRPNSDSDSEGGEGSTTKPTQTAPAPTEPTSTEPAPTESESTAPPPTETEPTSPEPTKPVPTEPEPTDPAPTEPEEPLDVSVKEKDGPVWTQQTAINLFADILGTGRKLMPGSRGSYEFQVGNYNSYDVTYTMQISAPQGQLLLPLRYRLKSGGEYLCGDSKNWLDAGQLSAAAVTLPAGEEKEYLLEWQWLFEGGDDSLDTAIGSGQNLEYEVIVTIHIEQLTP